MGENRIGMNEILVRKIERKIAEFGTELNIIRAEARS
jgi:hypothetical protein